MKNKLVLISGVLTIAILVYIGKAGAEASREEATKTETEATKEVEIEVSGIERTKESVEAPNLYDVPLTVELQLHIINECAKYDIPPSIVMAMAERESNFNPNAIGDGGDSLGMLQVQPMWHQGRMDRLGVTNLLDPFQNVIVAIDFLAELKTHNEDILWILTAYNGGMLYANGLDGYSVYATEIYKRAMELEENR